MMLNKSKNGKYLELIKGSPKPLIAKVKKRVNFSEVDLMGIVWYGQYAKYFEEAASQLNRHYKFSFKDFRIANLSVPIVQLHIDYRRPLVLDEEFTVQASWIWTEAAKITTEYKIIKQNGEIAVTGYTIQVFVDSITNETYFIAPKFLERFREKWKLGTLNDKQRSK